MAGLVIGPRPGQMRDRRGRGQRGVAALPGPLSPLGIPRRRTRRAEFERVVERIVTSLEPAFRAEADRIEVIVEDAPLLPAEWDDAVPSSIVSVDAKAEVTRVVLYRMQICQHATTTDDIEHLTWSVLLDQLAAIWHVSPDDLDPR